MKIAIYIRVSTEDQAKEGYSLKGQRECLESFAMREGYEIYKIYSDVGISAFSTQREALQELLKDAKDKKFDLVLVYKVDRFSIKDMFNLVDKLSSCGVGFKLAAEPFDTTKIINLPGYQTLMKTFRTFNGKKEDAIGLLNNIVVASVLSENPEVRIKCLEKSGDIVIEHNKI